MTIPESAVQALLEVQKDLAVACWLDWEFDCAGNSYNAHEAEGGLKAAFESLGLAWLEYTPTKEDLLAAILQAGEDPDDYDLE